MNRTIKFRVWDKRYSRWYTDPKELIWSQTGYREPYNGDGSESRVDCLISAFSLDAYDKYDRENFILEQFTSLTDKNGKEIYEGDIVEEQENGAKRQIIFYQFGASYLNVPSKWMFDLHTFFSLHSWKTYILDATISRQRVVVGNIHENPEFSK